MCVDMRLRVVGLGCVSCSECMFGGVCVVCVWMCGVCC